MGHGGEAVAAGAQGREAEAGGAPGEGEARPGQRPPVQRREVRVGPAERIFEEHEKIHVAALRLARRTCGGICSAAVFVLTVPAGTNTKIDYGPTRTFSVK